MVEGIEMSKTKSSQDAQASKGVSIGSYKNMVQILVY